MSPAHVRPHAEWTITQLFLSLIPIAFWQVMVRVVNRNLIKNVVPTSRNPLTVASIGELIRFYGKHSVAVCQQRDNHFVIVVHTHWLTDVLSITSCVDSLRKYSWEQCKERERTYEEGIICFLIPELLLLYNLQSSSCFILVFDLFPTSFLLSSSALLNCRNESAKAWCEKIMILHAFDPTRSELIELTDILSNAFKRCYLQYDLSTISVLFSQTNINNCDSLCYLINTVAVLVVAVDEHMNAYQPTAEAKKKADEEGEPIPVTFILTKMGYWSIWW